jgi:hypothetical protein
LRWLADGAEQARGECSCTERGHCRADGHTNDCSPDPNCDTEWFNRYATAFDHRSADADYNVGGGSRHDPDYTDHESDAEYDDSDNAVLGDAGKSSTDESHDALLNTVPADACAERECATSNAPFPCERDIG